MLKGCRGGGGDDRAGTVNEVFINCIWVGYFAYVSEKKW